MCKMRQRWLWLVVSAAVVLGPVAFTPFAFAQGPFQRFTGLFGPKTPAPEPKRVESPNRLMEIQVELAWLADPVTFPYYLEARVDGQAVAVRGYVPTRAVREQAVKLARLHCPLGVVDAIKEHPSVAVRLSPRPPEHLEKAVQTALREAFPKQHQNLFVKCNPDGNVGVSGIVSSFEHKLSVSQALRRLHGCTSITNLTQVSGTDLAQAPAGARINTAAKTQGKMRDPTAMLPVNGRPGEQSPTGSQKKSGFFGWSAKAPPTAPDKPREPIEVGPVNDPSGTQPSITRVSRTDPQSEAKPRTPGNPGNSGKPGNAYETRGMVILGTNEHPLPDPKATPEPKATAPVVAVSQPKVAQGLLPKIAPSQPTAKTPGPGAPTAAQVKKRLEAALPGNRDVQVALTADSRLRIELKARPGEEFSALAGQILSLRELEPFGERVDLHIQMPALEK